MVPAPSAMSRFDAVIFDMARKLAMSGESCSRSSPAKEAHRETQYFCKAARASPGRV